MANRAKIPSLTSTRFIAAFLIVLAHTSGPAPFGYQFSQMSEFILGSAGVSFFFVLSGFILTYTYGQLETKSAVRNFWAARIARVWPTHALTFLLCIALLPANQWALSGDALLPALANITLTHAVVPVPQYYFSFNAPSWSISTEAYFYLLYPLAILGMIRKPFMTVTAAGIAVISMIAASVALDLPAYSAEAIARATSHGMISVNPAARFFEFSCGMFAAQIWPTARKHIVLGLGAFTVLEAVSLAAVILSVIGFQYLAVALETRRFPDALTLWVHFGASAFPFAAFILVLSLEGGYLAKALSVRPMVILGEISFAMYMLHQIALRVLVAQGMHAPAGLAWPMFAAFCLFIVGLSYLVWVLVERPARRALSQALRLTPASGSKTQSLS